MTNATKPYTAPSAPSGGRAANSSKSKYLLGKILTAFPVCVMFAANWYLELLARRAAAGESGTEYIALIMLPVVVGALIALIVTLISIGPWRTAIPMRVRLVRAVLISAGLVAIYLFFNG